MANPSEQKRLLSESKLHIARAKAIDAYATLEQGLCMVLTEAAGLKPEAGGIIFYRVTNTRSRMAIIDKLVRLKLGKTDKDHRPFLNSVLKAVGALDQTRNEAIHWHPVLQIYGGAEEDLNRYQMELMPPNHWGWDSNTPSLDNEKLDAFAAECDVYARALNMFGAMLADFPEVPPSLQIFREPLVYPLPEGHLLARNA